MTFNWSLVVVAVVAALLSTAFADTLHVSGFKQCGYFQRAKRLAESFSSTHDVDIVEFPSRGEYKQALGKLATNHRTSPFVFVSSSDVEVVYGLYGFDFTTVQVVGGYDDLQALYVKSTEL